MPIIDGITYIDNTYLRDIATCSTRAFIMRIHGYQSIEKRLDAAHVGSTFHAALEVFHNPKTGGSIIAALEAADSKYDELMPPLTLSAWDDWKPRAPKRS